MLNAAAVARVLHGCHSALFPWRDFREPYQRGGYGGGGGGGSALWARYAAYPFDDVRRAAARVLHGMAAAGDRMTAPR